MTYPIHNHTMVGNEPQQFVPFSIDGHVFGSNPPFTCRFHWLVFNRSFWSCG